MNPNASSFTPSWGTAPPVEENNAPKAPKIVTLGVPAPKKEEKVEKEETWEDKATETPKTTEKPQSEAKYEPTEEELNRELERMALEEDDPFDKSDQVFEGKEFEEDPRDHVNVIFIGHVDAGKSTLSGSVLFHSGMVDSRTMEKYEKEGKGQALTFITDTNEEERAKGITVEVGRAYFETETKRYTILDAPGHKNYVPNMIGAAVQADVGILVISARKGEFETGFNRGGQTREHAVLAKTLGVNILVVVVNKMDDPTVKWEKERYDEIVNQLSDFLKKTGYDLKNNVHFVPVSGFKGANVKDKVGKEACPWYDGPSLLGQLDLLKIPGRMPDYPLRIPLVDKGREHGMTVALGKIEAGTLTKGQQLVIVPNNIHTECVQIKLDETHSFKRAKPGENIRVYLKGVDEEALHQGFVICDPKSPVPCQSRFEAQVAIIELLPHKSVFTAGYSAVVHIHTAVEECNIIVLLDQLDKKTGKSVKKKPQFVTTGSVVRCIIECAQPVCLELFSNLPQLGRFTLRDEGKTIAIGKVTALGPRKKAN